MFIRRVTMTPKACGSSADTMMRDGASTMSDVASRIQDTASELGQKASDLGHDAVDAIDARRGTAANGLDSAAAGVHANADKLPPSMSGFAHQAADGFGVSASYLRENKLGDMVADLEAYLKAHPGQALAGAVVLGFFAGRMLRRD
jgi:ElaB/YqjD/DUF883 family membrane-anchored ribosome-binding protein